jgi:hypothetical protein
MAATLDRRHTGEAPAPPVWVPPPAAERAGPTPLQLVWTIIMVAFLATVFSYVLSNLV